MRPFTVSDSGKPALGEERWQISRGPGNWPVWRTDREIFFSAGFPWLAGSGVMAVSVNSNRTGFESGIPQRLFASGGRGGWDVTSDGQRFLTTVPQVQRAAPRSIGVILNWPALLKN